MSSVLYLAGLRNDGRKDDDFRAIECFLSCPSDSCSEFASSDGFPETACVKIGATTISARITGPSAKIKRKRASGEGPIVCSLIYPPFAGGDRFVRRRRADRRSEEIATAIENLFSSTVILPAGGPRVAIHIELLVSSLDDNLLSCAINAATLGLANSGIHMKGLMVCCTVGVLDGKIKLDPTSLEISSMGASEINVARFVHERKKYAMVLADSQITADELSEALGAADDLIEMYGEHIKETLIAHADLVMSGVR